MVNCMGRLPHVGRGHDEDVSQDEPVLCKKDQLAHHWAFGSVALDIV